MSDRDAELREWLVGNLPPLEGNDAETHRAEVQAWVAQRLDEYQRWSKEAAQAARLSDVRKQFIEVQKQAKALAHTLDCLAPLAKRHLNNQFRAIAVNWGGGHDKEAPWFDPVRDDGDRMQHFIALGLAKRREPNRWPTTKRVSALLSSIAESADDVYLQISADKGGPHNTFTAEYGTPDGQLVAATAFRIWQAGGKCTNYSSSLLPTSCRALLELATGKPVEGDGLTAPIRKAVKIIYAANGGGNQGSMLHKLMSL